MDLTNIPAVVTGAGSGLGEATARKLAGAGARVALLDFNLEAAEAVAAEIGGAAFKCDVSSDDSGATAMKAAREAFGAARVLVNCAGIGPAQKILGRSGLMPLEDYARVIGVNLIGTFNMLRHFVEGVADEAPLETGERGVVINTASVAAYEGQIGQTAYASSKGGVVSLTLPAARELASKSIRVCTIAPGIFETAMLKGLPQAAQASLGVAVPFPSRLGKPDEYANLAVHIIENQMLNGETIRLDGALRMAPK